MLFPSLPLFGFARSGMLQLPGSFSVSGGAIAAHPLLSAGVSTVLIGLALYLVWSVLRRSP